MKFYRYTEDTSGLLYKKYHRLTRTGNISKFWGEVFIFDNFTVDFRAVFNFNVLKKLHLFVCRCTNSIKGILMELFYYSSSQYTKFK